MSKSNRNFILKIFKKDVQDKFERKIKNEGINISRREFVRNTAMASLAVGATVSFLESCGIGEEDLSKPRVAIIGGGIAGLHAAHILNKSKIKFDLFEASKRIGGRIYTVTDQLGDGLITEIGGEFIDSNHVDMINLVKEYGLELYDIEDDIKRSKLVQDTYFFSGKHYSEKELITEFSKYSESIAEDIIKVVDQEDDSIINSLDSISITEYLSKKGLSGWIFDLLVNAFTSEYGLDSNEQSSLNLIYMLNPETENGFKIFGESDERYKIKGGNSRLTEKMYEQLKHSIKLEYKLNSVSENNGKYTLAFENGETNEYEFVLLAIPFSVLRNITLNVSLPENKIKAIKELGYGSSSKIIFGVNERSWREKGLSGYLFSNQIQNGWDSTIGQSNNEGAGSYTVFLGGREGKEASLEKLPKYTQVFNQIFNTNNEVINDKSAVYNWLSSPHSLGGYSVYKIGQWSSIAGYEKEPVNNLFFAGEHCSEEFQGYMNGGAETGRLAAENIIQKLKLLKTQH